MRIAFRLVLTVLVTLLSPLVKAQTCDPAPRLVVRTLDSAAVDVRAGLTSRELTNRYRGALGGKLLGSTDAHFAYRTGLDDRCSATVVVELQLVKQVVHIASDLPTDSCTYRETLAHEMVHVAINRQVLQAVQAELASAFDTPGERTAPELLKLIVDHGLPLARQRFTEARALHLDYDNADRHAERTAECSTDLALRAASL